MGSVHASSAVDRGFEPRSGQTKDYRISSCCFSAKHAALRSKSKDWLARKQNNVSECPSTTCLSADCCFSELALCKSNSACWSRTKRISSSSHWKLTCYRHDIAAKLLSWRALARSLTHSLTHKSYLSFNSLGKSYLSFNRGEDFLRNQPIRNKNCLWWPCLITDRDEMSTLYRGPSIDASYQVSVHLTKRFQRRRLLQIGQSETRIVCGGHVC